MTTTPDPFFRPADICWHHPDYTSKASALRATHAAARQIGETPDRPAYRSAGQAAHDAIARVENGLTPR